METQKEFKIKVKRNIPFVSKGLFWIFIFFLIILSLCNVFFLPSEHASLEMKTTYWMLAIPELVKNVMGYTILGTLVFGLLNYFVKRSETGVFVLKEHKVIIQTKTIYKEFVFNNIKKFTLTT